MPCVMEGGNGEAVDVNQFIATGRTGRRNAIADLEENATTSTADLPEALQKLSCGEGTSQEPQAGSSGEGTSGEKTQVSGS